MPISICQLLKLKGKGNGFNSVLAKWSDGLYYNVQIIDQDVKANKCHVKFEDDLTSWIPVADLHAALSLDSLDDADIICCLCEGDKSEPPNEIVVCDLCQQGFHTECHLKDDPDNDVTVEESDWMCKTCTLLSQKKKTNSPAIKKKVTPKKAGKIKTSHDNSSPKSKSFKTEEVDNESQTPEPKPIVDQEQEDPGIEVQSEVEVQTESEAQPFGKVKKRKIISDEKEGLKQAKKKSAKKEARDNKVLTTKNFVDQLL